MGRTGRTVFVECASRETVLIKETTAEGLQSCVNRLEGCVVSREGGGVRHELVRDGREACDRGVKEGKVEVQA